MAILNVENKKVNPLNQQVSDIITALGDEFGASAIARNMAEAIEVADTQELAEKIKAMKARGKIKDIAGLREFFKKRLEKKIREAQENGVEINSDKSEEKEEKKQNEQELFILTANGNSERIVDKKAETGSFEASQKENAQRVLRVLEAMEKARDAIEKRKEIPEMDLSYLKDLTPRELAKQMAVFKDFGLQPVVLGRDGQVREDPERQVTLETITREDLEQGDIAFAIPFEKLQTREWRKMAEKSKMFFKEMGIKPEYEPETTIEDDVINAIAGVDKTKSGEPRNTEEEVPEL